MVLARPRVRSTTKIDSKNSLYPHSHFTEHLVGAFEKSPRKSNLNHETLSFFYPTTQELYQDEFLQQSKQSNQSKWTDWCISIKNNTAELADKDSAPATESGWSCNTRKSNRAGAQLTLE
jgi:hypothetical protein